VKEFVEKLEIIDFERRLKNLCVWEIYFESEVKFIVISLE